MPRVEKTEDEKTVEFLNLMKGKKTSRWLLPSDENYISVKNYDYLVSLIPEIYTYFKSREIDQGAQMQSYKEKIYERIGDDAEYGNIIDSKISNLILSRMITNKTHVCVKSINKCGTLSFGTPNQEKIANETQFIISKEHYANSEKIKELFKIQKGGNRTRRRHRKHSNKTRRIRR